jgi:hypothetical protein
MNRNVLNQRIRGRSHANGMAKSDLERKVNKKITEILVQRQLHEGYLARLTEFSLQSSDIHLSPDDKNLAEREEFR